MKALLLASLLILRASAMPQEGTGIVRGKAQSTTGIPGKVELDGGLPLPRFFPSLYVNVTGPKPRPVLGEDGRRIQRSGTAGATGVARDGSFRLALPDGEYTLSLITSVGDPLTADDGYYVKSMSFGSVDLLTQKLTVQEGASPSTIVITLAPLQSGK